MLEIRGKEFYMDGEKINIYSGVIHYFRVHQDHWEDRLRKLKAAGFNTVETYMCWNLHEPKKGEFCFDGMLDFVRFVATAQELGLYIIVRPGPYICAEWDLGGLPPWLLADENLRFRCCDETYLAHVADYYKKILPMLTDYQMTRGGKLIAMQVENEYGSYGNDKEYLEFVRKLMADCGVDVLLFTSDGENPFMLSGGSLPDVYKVANFGGEPKRAFPYLETIQPDKPLMCGEFWCGWFDRWGEKHHTRKAKDVKEPIKQFFDYDGNFNVYMFHGGTNFNFWAGANFYDKYCPTTTSYDYDALLNEYGDYTEKYHVFREAIHKKLGKPMAELPPAPKLQSIGKIKLTQSAALLENLQNIGEYHRSAYPHYMEHYGQNFGMILYHTEIKGHYEALTLTGDDVHDIAYVYINGKFAGKYDRSALKKKSPKESFSFDVPAFQESCTIDILVEGMGRINYGEHMYDRKGVGMVRLGQQLIFGWDVYCLPLDKLDALDFSAGAAKYPMFLKGTFQATSRDDCFVDIRGFKKGCVYVNGFNLGRYWDIGPQKTLYLPGPLLKTDGENEIIVLEQEGCTVQEIGIIDKHML